MNRVFREVKKMLCPYCHSELNAVECPDDPGAKPMQDDITVCNHCASILMFNMDMTVRLPSIDEICRVDQQQLEYVQSLKKIIEKEMTWAS